MPDYKEMYFKLFRATEQAANALIDAQRECEMLYLSASEPELHVLSLEEEMQKNAEKA